MPSRLLPLFSIIICVFAILISLLVVAQSSHAPMVNQPPGLHQMQQENYFTPQGALALLKPSFAPAVVYGSGGYEGMSVAVADVNGDGKPDLIVANYCAEYTCATGGSVGVLLGNGNGTFQPAVTYASGASYPASVTVADVNGDGKLDLVVAGDGTVGVLLGKGDGTFQTAVTYASGGGLAHAVAVADVNGDGKPDLIVAACSIAGCTSSNGLVGVLLGNGDGTFQAAVTYASGGYAATSVAVADVNGDGKPDLVVANQCADSTGCNDGSVNGTVAVLLGNGNGTFQTAVAYDSGGPWAMSVAVADVNADRKPDLLVANWINSTVGVLLGHGDGTFQAVATYDSGPSAPVSVAVADVNGDGKPDLVVATLCGTVTCGGNGAVSVLLGNGDGTFQAAVSYDSSGYEAASVAVADVNGDGKPDLVFANCGGYCEQQNSSGTVGVLINETSPWRRPYPALGEQVDYFGEGKADFTVWRPSNGTYYSSDSAGNLLTHQWGATTDIPVIGDYDGDGKTDFAAWRPSNGTWYVIQSSTGKILSQQWGKKGDIPVPGDYDGDGKTDFAVWRPSTGYWYIIQSSNGLVVQKQWGWPTDIPVPGDYDGDGKTDIAVWRPSTGYWYIVQSSNGQVVKKQWGWPTDKPVPGDYDGDGKTDIAVWRPSNGYWYVVQSSNGQVAKQQWGTNGDVPVARDYDGDGKADCAVWRPSNGTWYVIESSNSQEVKKQWGTSTDVPMNKPVGQ